jgi:hypothetical protein
MFTLLLRIIYVKSSKKLSSFGSEMAMVVTDKAIRLHGGYGCTKDFPVERYFRDAKTLSLQKSSDHVKLMAGKMLLDVPLGPPPKAGGPPRLTAVRRVSPEVSG